MRTIRTLGLAATAIVLLSPALASAHGVRMRTGRCYTAAHHGRTSSIRSTRRARVCYARDHGRRTERRTQRSSDAGSTAAAIAQSRAAVIAAVLATPCQNTGLTPEAGNLAVIRSAVLCLVNQVRAEHDIAPLTLSTDLDTAAEEHSGELVQADYFAHVSPDGETPVQRIRDTGYIPGPSAGYVIGENLAWGTYGLSAPSAIVAAWVASPGHLANILESQYRETGIGVVAQVPSTLSNGAPGATYAQEFGDIIQ